jgi:hypothetical protein
MNRKMTAGVGVAAGEGDMVNATRTIKTTGAIRGTNKVLLCC